MRTGRETAGPSTTLRSGRDDNSAVPARASVRSTWPCNRIVIPTGAYPDFLLRGTPQQVRPLCGSRGAPQVPRLPQISCQNCSSGGFHAAFLTESRTRGRWGVPRSRKSGYAPVGLTILLHGQVLLTEALAGTAELSSRPERSVVEGPAVSLPVFTQPGRAGNQFPTSHTSLYGNSKIDLESDLGPEGR